MAVTRWEATEDFALHDDGRHFQWVTSSNPSNSITNISCRTPYIEDLNVFQVIIFFQDALCVDDNTDRIRYCSNRPKLKCEVACDEFLEELRKLIKADIGYKKEDTLNRVVLTLYNIEHRLLNDLFNVARQFASFDENIWQLMKRVVDTPVLPFFIALCDLANTDYRRAIYIAKNNEYKNNPELLLKLGRYLESTEEGALKAITCYCAIEAARHIQDQSKWPYVWSHNPSFDASRDRIKIISPLKEDSIFMKLKGKANPLGNEYDLSYLTDNDIECMYRQEQELAKLKASLSSSKSFSMFKSPETSTTTVNQDADTAGYKL